MFDLARAIAELITGIYKVRKDTDQAEEWFRIGVSLFGTAFVSFWGTWGLSIWALYPRFGLWPALVLGYADGCIVMASTVLILWKRSPLMRGIPIAAPMNVEQRALEQSVALTTPTPLKEKK
jgi:hypothetical protein